jgi:5-methylcytosine-specific restriction endonuclease McrA
MKKYFDRIGRADIKRYHHIHDRIYLEWRNNVFERDNFTCQDCDQIGGYLNADHIKPFAFYPELRFELSNGRTLCHDCHKKTDTYGVKLQHLEVRYEYSSLSCI